MSKFALVHVPIAALHAVPDTHGELADEVLHGMTVEILETTPDGWARVRTAYQYEGYTRGENLVADDGPLSRWQGQPKSVVTRAQADVLNVPNIRGWRVASLPRGAVVSLLPQAEEDGWVCVGLADGRQGYTRASHLGEYRATWSPAEEPTLRKRLMDTALSYLGVQYRWGGKTPQGIDCSGLCSMAYLVNGVVIYRDADIGDGFCMRQIPLAEAGEGDLIFFPGHVAMHLGNGHYIHATAKNGSDGVVLNSLNPQDEDFRPDLLAKVRFAGSIFTSKAGDLL